MSLPPDSDTQTYESKQICFVKSWQMLGLDLDIEKEDIVPIKKRKVLPPLNYHNNIVTKFKNVDGRLMECSQKAINEFTSPCFNNTLSSFSKYVFIFYL